MACRTLAEVIADHGLPPFGQQDWDSVLYPVGSLTSVLLLETSQGATVLLTEEKCLDKDAPVKVKFT